MDDWTAFGRVDADGTVYVKTAGGERVVGSWQAGSPEEGLAHFARRLHELEGDRGPVQGDPRRVEDDPRRRPQGRHRAVEAFRRRPRRIHPPPGRPLRDPGPDPQAGAGP